MRFHVGDTVSSQEWTAVDGAPVNIPHPGGRIVLLKFSRWAGCPICNLHITSVSRRISELEAAGIEVVMVFHSPAQDVIELRGALPFTLIADPDKEKYRAFSVGRSLLSLAHPVAFRVLRSEAKLGNKAQRIHGGVLGLPADFLIGPQAQIIAAHYGSHADDNLEVSKVLRLTEAWHKRG